MRDTFMSWINFIHYNICILKFVYLNRIIIRKQARERVKGKSKWKCNLVNYFLYARRPNEYFEVLCDESEEFMHTGSKGQVELLVSITNGNLTNLIDWKKEGKIGFCGAGIDF